MTDENTDVIAVLGAGVSMAATGGAKSASWKGLLEKGIEKVEKVQDASTLEGWPARRRKVLSREQITVPELLSIASEIKYFLDDEGNQWTEFLSETVGNLDVKDGEIIDAIETIGVPIITTNYDSIIESYLEDRRPITWKDHNNVQNALKGESDDIVHIHGYWNDEGSVVFDFEDYERVQQSEPFQTLLRGSAALQSFLFIGVGDGLQDPHFEELFEWVDQFTDKKDDHYLLVRQDKKQGLEEKYSANNLSVLSYGENYDCLPGFLEDIAPSEPGTTGGGFLISHPTRIKRLKERAQSAAQRHESFLLSDNLEFVEPEGKEFHPRRILHRLDNPNSPDGVLLYGSGGVGKTRILLETATRADAREDWQVLHTVATGELNNRTLATALENAIIDLPDAEKILLVVDEVENSDLDFDDIDKRIRHDVDQGLNILACVRRAYYRRLRDNNELDLFGGHAMTIRMDPSKAAEARTLTERISAQIREEIAPTAIEDLDDGEKVAELCGSRPAIALLIARELERRAQNKRENEEVLSEDDVEDIRPDDLVSWLDKQLREDELKHGEGELSPKESNKRRASAAVLAAAPSKRSELNDVALEVLSHSQYEFNFERHYHIVQNLKTLGWLEERELAWEGQNPGAQGLAPAHNVVTDELLNSVLKKEVVLESDNLLKKRLNQLLSPCSSAPVAWSNMTRSLSRLFGRIQEEESKASATKFSDQANAWLQENASELQDTPIMKDENERYRSSNALGAALDAGLWRQDLIVRNLALPWLEQHGKSRVARFLIMKVLTTECEQDIVIEIALEWINDYIPISDSAHVIYVVAKQINGQYRTSGRVAELGVRWFEHHGERDDGSIWKGQFILTELLQWDKKHCLDDLEYWAHQWLEEFGHHRKARYAIYTLLKQVYSERPTSEKVKSHALGWLNLHGTEVQAQWVIAPLLENGDLEGKTLTGVVNYADTWLSDSARALSADARYVLQSALEILRKEDKGVALFDEVDPIDKSLVWLDKYWYTDNDEIKVELVIAALLRVMESDDDRFQHVLKFASDWLDQHREEERAQLVLSRILRHPDVDDDQKSAAAEWSVEWLESYPHSQKQDFIINSLLLNWESVPSDEQKRKNVLEAALELGQEVIQNEQTATLDTYQAKWLLKNVIGAEPSTEYSAASQRLISDLGHEPEDENFCDWLQKQGQTIEKTLNRTAPGSEERDPFLKEGTDLLCNPRTYQCDGWTHLLEKVLECDDLDPQYRRDITEEINKWIYDLYDDMDTNSIDNIDWFFAYQTILENGVHDLLGDNFIEIGMNWLKMTDNFQDKSWRHMFVCMIENSDEQDQLVDLGKTWLHGDKEEQRHHSGIICSSILNNASVNMDDVTFLSSKASNWLRMRLLDSDWERVFKTTMGAIDQIDEDIRPLYKKMIKNLHNFRRQNVGIFSLRESSWGNEIDLLENYTQDRGRNTCLNIDLVCGFSPDSLKTPTNSR